MVVPKLLSLTAVAAVILGLAGGVLSAAQGVPNAAALLMEGWGLVMWVLLAREGAREDGGAR